MSVLNGIKDYLDMHKKERRGISILVLILGVILLTMFLIPYVIPPSLPNKLELEARIEALLEAEKQNKEQLAVKREQNAKSPDYHRRSNKKKPISKKLFTFDPNTCSDSDWKNLGLNSGQIKTINNFKKKGGKFYKAEDVSKMYTISSVQYDELAPFISIDKTQFYSEKSYIKDTEPTKDGPESMRDKPIIETLMININLADTLELDKLSGIGPYYARKIAEYRNQLGGFISTEQLLEIWNFKPETFEKIQDQIHLGEETVKKISINDCTAKELAEHPYFNWKMANALVNYRVTHGEYSSINEITKSHLISEEACLKMKPYLKLN